MTKYFVPDNYSIFDVAIETYGTIEKALQLIQENGLNNLDYTFEGKLQTIQFDETQILQKTSPLSSENKDVIRDKFIVQDGQSIFDIALQVGYTLDSIIELAQLNKIDSINQNLRSGQIFTYSESKINNIELYNYWLKTGYITNTSVPKIISGASFDNSFNDDFDT